MSQFREKSDYEVFLSFRGEDVRTTFISHLLNALQQRGIKTFYDDDELPRGGDIQLELYRAIEASRLSVVTFSPKHATSRWCLDELVKIMELKRSHRHMVLPVFYGVHPSHVRHQSGPYKKAFEQHKVRFRHELDKVDEWRQALKFAADLAGFSFQYKDNGSEAEFIKHVVSEVVKKLDARQLSVPNYLVGGEPLVKKVCAWLHNGCSEVQLGILYGPGGVGKTTTAKVAYNGHYHRFERSSFLAGIRSASGRENDFIHLQEQLVSNISGNDTVKIYNIHEGREKIRKVTGSKKVFIVMDDVEDAKQLKEMFDYPDWFFPGSKVLITTRNKGLGKHFCASTVLFQVHPLTFEKSADLFCHQAFRQSQPPQEYIQISNQFIEYCEGLPLALEVLGSSLRNESLEIWECQYAKLKEFPNQTVQSVLKLSFDSLEDNYRDIFLHVAFFMVGMKKSFVLKILKDCRLHAETGLNNLIEKVLVSVDECGDTLMMHNLIQQMAFEVVRLEAPSEPGQRSRLVCHEDITEVLLKNRGTSKLKGLRLELPDLISSDESFQSNINSSLATSSLVSPSRSISHGLEPIKASAFSKMDNLDILILGNVQLEGDLEDFPKMIKCLVWQGCQLQCIPSNFELDKVVLLDMQNSCLVQAWKGSKYVGRLKVLDLSYSQQLECTPDLSSALNLEFLSLEGCQSLVRMHESVGNLRRLTTLNLKGCQRLESFSIPPSVVEWNLDGCGNLFNAFNEMEPLALQSVPQHQAPARFPMSTLGIYLPFLDKLDLANCGITRDDVLEQLSSATSLRHLNLSGNPIRVLNNEKRAFRKLRYLELTGCTELQSVSQLFPHHIATVSFCSSLQKITYIYEGKNSKGNYVLQSVGSGLLDGIEIDMGFDDSQLTAWTRDMYEGQTAILGFPGLETFDMDSNLSFSGKFAFEQILFYGGTIQVCLPGDHIAKWFPIIEVATDTQPVYFTVPYNSLPVRAFNLGFAISTDEGEFAVFRVTIENQNLTSGNGCMTCHCLGRGLLMQVVM